MLGCEWGGGGCPFLLDPKLFLLIMYQELQIALLIDFRSKISALRKAYKTVRVCHVPGMSTTW